MSRTSSTCSSASCKRFRSDDYSSSDNGKLDSDCKRLKTSDWKLEELTDIGIYYAPRPNSVLELLEKLKARKGRLVKMPGFIESFIEFTKEILTFSIKDINWNKCRNQQNITEERVALKTIEDNQRKLSEFMFGKIETADETSILHDRVAKRLFNRWYEHCFDFLNEIKVTLSKLNNPIPDLPGEILQLPVFRQLFMRFVEIFCLTPEVGEIKRKTITIRNKAVGIIPDIRFYESDGGGSYFGAPLLLMLTEVKRDGLKTINPDDEDDNTAWIECRLKSKVLGQIGIQMVSESKNSSFGPHTLGIVCIGTEIIFPYLELKPDQYDLLMKNKKLDGITSCIQYTKSFDIMVKEDRDQLIEIFFWLGCAQKHNFKKFLFP